MVMMCLGILGNRWVSLDVHFVWVFEQLVSLGLGLCASKLMVMMCLGILTHLAVLGCYNIKPGHDDGDTQIEHVS